MGSHSTKVIFFYHPNEYYVGVIQCDPKVAVYLLSVASSD